MKKFEIKHGKGIFKLKLGGGKKFQIKFQITAKLIFDESNDENYQSRK